eukprot:TRINITY_DN10039_c0_g1_i1.p2 TRINITY_DN10039_c0_g1~~TRINITY_DN10039_c0_g1_i1.p2  ORF type:complete len:200 (-),score=38.35 TRINITY_DN10039_c0_g1_i1:59-658(-)
MISSKRWAITRKLKKMLMVSLFVRRCLTLPEKITALNKLHSDKIRALMNSIQLLKKENAQLKKGAQEHKRSDLISNLNKDISDQESIIEALRRLVNNDEKVDAAIVETLNKGPPRYRAPSREELLSEIRKLKGALAKYSNSPPSQIQAGDKNKKESAKEGEADNSLDEKGLGLTKASALVQQEIDVVGSEELMLSLIHI